MLVALCTLVFCAPVGPVLDNPLLNALSLTRMANAADVVHKSHLVGREDSGKFVGACVLCHATKDREGLLVDNQQRNTHKKRQQGSTAPKKIRNNSDVGILHTNKMDNFQDKREK
jgi:hypothetical protein